MDFTWLGIQICIYWSQIPLKKGRGVDQKTIGVTTICLTQRDTSPSHSVDQAVDCGLWNVIPLLSMAVWSCWILSGNWNKLLYTSIQSIQNMLNGWHVWWAWRNMEELGYFQLSFRTLISPAIALVYIPAVSMPIALSLKTWDICGIVLCDKTAHFRVTFNCPQHKVHLCNNHAV